MNVRRLLAQSDLTHSASFWLVRSKARLLPAGSGPVVLINGMPKSGTHLLASILDHTPGYTFSGIHLRTRDLEQFPEQNAAQPPRPPQLDWAAVREMLQSPKPGQYMSAHLSSHPELSSILSDLDQRVIFLTRDPRDIVVSSVNYIKSLRRHRHHKRFTQLLANDEERMLAVIHGFAADEAGPGLFPLADRLRGFLGWRKDPSAVWCNFEALAANPDAGGEEAQQRTLEGIFAHLELDLDGERALAIARRAWGTNSATFRSGRVGSWRESFTPAVEGAFGEAVDADLLTALGYSAGP